MIIVMYWTLKTEIENKSRSIIILTETEIIGKLKLKVEVKLFVN